MPDSYTVLARRYRPQTFEELVGQEPVARALQNAIKSNRVAHAYLFTGIRGVGKTTVARILAKALNCENGPTPTPCNTCPACKSIAAGEDVDVLEIDGASNNGVEEVRELRGNVQYMPSRARFKIYIIDEVHMLSGAAFNALLKTLEEPPAHVKFIFATTDVQKLPVTILSRCQRFDLGGISLPQITERLKSIVEQEGMQADAEALELIARRANGSMRDAQSVLDQLLAFGGERLTADQVHHLLGTAADEHVLALAEAVLSDDPRRALEQLEEATARGFQLAELTDQLIACWRDLMLVHCAGAEARGLSVQQRHRETIARLAKPLSLDTILAGLDILSATRARLRTTTHGRTLIEMALVRLGRLGDLVPLAQVAQWVSQLRDDRGSPASTVRAAPPEAVKKKPLTFGADGAPAATASAAEITPATLPVVWEGVLSGVGMLMANALGKAGLPAIFGPNALAIRFPASYNKEREYCQEPTRLAKIEAVLARVTGQAWSLRVESTAGPAPAAPTSVPDKPEATPVRPRRNDRSEAEKEPLIKRALEVLGGQILQVAEGFGAAYPVRSQTTADAADQES
jgi:DNA polymerase-3 subunit gamma/tau